VVSQAKHKLGIYSYPSSKQEELLVAEGIRLFQDNLNHDIPQAMDEEFESLKTVYKDNSKHSSETNGLNSDKMSTVSRPSKFWLFRRSKTETMKICS
jgi:hypothetical protein